MKLLILSVLAVALSTAQIPVPTQNPEAGCFPDSPDCYPPPPPPKPKMVSKTVKDYPGGPRCRCGCNIPVNQCGCNQSPSTDAARKCKKI